MEQKPETENLNPNLRPFATGFDKRRNLKGRPKGAISRRTAVKNLLQNNINQRHLILPTAKLYGEQLKGNTAMDVLVDALYNQALSGDTRSTTLLLNIMAEDETSPDNIFGALGLLANKRRR
jgi:hypothetical protein